MHGEGHTLHTRLTSTEIDESTTDGGGANVVHDCGLSKRRVRETKYSRVRKVQAPLQMIHETQVVVIAGIERLFMEIVWFQEIGHALGSIAGKRNEEEEEQEVKSWELEDLHLDGRARETLKGAVRSEFASFEIDPPSCFST